jgi:SsrA-binding protein
MKKRRLTNLNKVIKLGWKKGISLIVNKKARYEYEILKEWEAGIVLKGAEVKSVREGKVNFTNSFIRIKEGEAFLYNLHIALHSTSTESNYDPKRQRKLLLHKSEIKKILGILTQKGLTLIPLSVYFKKGRVKLEIGLAKGRKLYDKREKLKKRTAEKEIRQTLKSRERFKSK